MPIDPAELIAALRDPAVWADPEVRAAVREIMPEPVSAELVGEPFDLKAEILRLIDEDPEVLSAIVGMFGRLSLRTMDAAPLKGAPPMKPGDTFSTLPGADLAQVAAMVASVLRPQPAWIRRRPHERKTQ